MMAKKSGWKNQQSKHQRRNHHLREIILAILVVLSIVANICPYSVQAATPKVLVSGYKVSAATIYSGDNFDLTLEIQNTSKNKVKNMKVTVASEGGEIIPVSGTGSIYVAEIAGNEMSEQTFSMAAAAGLAEKTYKLSVKMEYENTSGEAFEMEDTLYLPVYLKQRVSVTDVMTDDAKVGDDVEITAQVNNLGEGTLYNVNACVEGKHVEKQETYIGNIDTGKSGSVDLLAKAIAVTDFDEMARAEDWIIVTYEDRNGDKHEEKVDVSFYIETVDYEDLEVLKEAPEKTGPATWQIILICACVLAVGVFVGSKVHKKSNDDESKSDRK